MVDANAAPQPPVSHRPVIPITLALMAGILVGNRLPGFNGAAVFLLLAAMGFLVFRLRQSRTAFWSALLACAAAGYLAMAPWIAPVRGPAHVTRFLDRGYWRITGTVAETPDFRLGRTRVVLAVETLVRDGRSHAVHGRIRLTVMGEATLSPGDRVTFAARLRSFRNFRNPGGFDYRRYMALQDIHGSAWVKAERLKQSGEAGGHAFSRRLHIVHRALDRMIDAAAGDRLADEAAVLKALVYGDRSGIGPVLRERFNRAGVGHLLAISGLHLGIVATVAVVCFRWLFAWVPALLWRGWSRRWAAAAALPAVLSYGVLAGMTPSTQRAAIMVAVCLAALIIGRTQDAINTLAVAALAILAVRPPALFSISFQLSFSAVLAIVYALDKLPIQKDPGDPPVRRTGKRLAGFLLVSVLAIAGTAPVGLYHFNRTSLAGLGANLLLVPLVGFDAVPLGLAAALASLVSPSLAILGFRMDLHLLKLALTVVDAFAGLPFADLYTVTPSLFEIGLYYLAGWSLLNLRRGRAARWVLAIVLLAASGDLLYWTHARLWHRDLRVTAIDVGQGSATLLELPGGAVVLMDGGGFSDNRVFDVGRQVVAPTLWRRKIATVDVIVLSHPNADHLNGLIAVARHFNVREMWTNGDVNTTYGYRELMRVCRARGIRVRPMTASAGSTAIGPVTLTVMHPPTRGTTAEPFQQEPLNDRSLVLRAVFGDTAFLIPGDIMARAEADLVQRFGERLASTVLFAPHHGSRTSSSATFVAAVHPDLVVISAGAGNRFGFPHETVLARYRDAGCRILCTCTDGAVTLHSDGRRIRTAP